MMILPQNIIAVEYQKIFLILNARIKILNRKLVCNPKSNWLQTST